MYYIYITQSKVVTTVLPSLSCIYLYILSLPRFFRHFPVYIYISCRYHGSSVTFLYIFIYLVVTTVLPSLSCIYLYIFDIVELVLFLNINVIFTGRLAINNQSINQNKTQSSQVKSRKSRFRSLQ